MPLIYFLIFSFLLLHLPVIRGQDIVPQPYVLQKSSAYKGLAYSGFRNQGPPNEFLDAKTIQTDMKTLASIGVKWIRTYSIDMGQDSIPSIAKDAGIDTFIGISINETTTMEIFKSQVSQLEQLFIKDSRLVPVVVVGNEVIYEKILPIDNLVRFYKYVQSRGFKAAIADTPATLLDGPNSQLLKDADIILLHIHPFFEKVQDALGNLAPHSRLTPDAAAAEYVVRVAQKTQQVYPNQLVLLGETGWPRRDDTAKDNVDRCRWCTPDFQKDFITVLTNRVVTNGIGMFLFEAFDEGWKSHVAEEGGAAPYWGVLRADRSELPVTKPVKDWLSSDDPIEVNDDMVCAGMEAMAECAPAATAEDGRIQEVLDRVCSEGRVICSYMDFPLMARCPLRPKTAWALSQYYQLKERQDGTCDFDGVAVVKPVLEPEDNGTSQQLPIIQAVAQLPVEDVPAESGGTSTSTTSDYAAVVVVGVCCAVLYGIHTAQRNTRAQQRWLEHEAELEVQTCTLRRHEDNTRSYGSAGGFPPDTYLALD